MLTIKVIKEQPEEVIARLGVKHFDARESVARITELDAQRRSAQQTMDASLQEQKQLAKQIGEKMKSGDKAAGEALRAQVQKLKEQSSEAEESKKQAEESIRQLLLTIPNMPHESVPEGKGAEDNVCVKTGGTMPQLSQDNKLPHWDLAKKYDLIDFELGVKISGAGFPVYKGRGARLQRALINYFLDKAIAAGFQEVEPPYVVNEDSGYGTGQLPDKEGQMYFAPSDNLYLIPTAEVPVTNIYRDVILEESQLPIKNVAYSACFRREAGSYG